MSEPLVSVCLITYNHVSFIKQAIESVLMQRIDFSCELIIADDYSTDGTREIVLDYKNRNPDFIKLILQEKNVGASKNWFDLLAASQSKYIAYFEGDDFWIDPDKLQKQVNILENNSSLIAVITNSGRCDTKGNIIDCEYFKVTKDNIPGIYNLHHFFQNNHDYPTGTVLFCNKLNEFKNSFHKIKNPYVGDWFLWIFLHLQGDFYYLDEVTSMYRINSNSISNTFDKVKRWEYDFIIRKQIKGILPPEYHIYLNSDWYPFLKLASLHKEGSKIRYIYYMARVAFSNPKLIFKKIISKTVKYQ